MPSFSLKTRITLLLPLSVTIALIGLLLIIQHLLQGYIKEFVFTQQLQIASNVADELDQKLAEAHSALKVLAKKLTPIQIADPDEALGFLLDRTEMTGLFDNGLFIFDRQGRIVAELPLGISRTGTDLSYREYLKTTFATMSPYISDPYVSSKSGHHPAIMLTVPVMDSDGTVLAVLGGSIDLLRPNFLGELKQRRIGRTGYMFLFDTKRTVIVHPELDRIMKQDIPRGANSLLDRAVDGFEGTGETVNSRGLKTLTAFKRLKSKNWIIGANFPVDEAYLPVNRVRNIFLVTLPLLSFTLFWFMRHFLNRLTKPITCLADHVENLPGKEGNDRFFPIDGEDEIATLGHAFNELVRETDQQRFRLEADLERHEQADALLHRQNEYLQALHETTLGLLSRHDMAGLLQTIVSRAGKLVGTEHCFVYLMSTDGTALNMVFQSGIYDSLAHYPISRGQGIAGRVWETGESIHVDDYCNWEGRLPDPERDELHAMAGVPLKVAGEVIGVLGLAFIERNRDFNHEQLEILEQFGELASLALENAHLVEESQRELSERTKAEERLRKLSVAVEQSPASIVITDLNGIIEYVNPHFTRLTGYTLEEAIGQRPSILKTGETSTAEYQQLWQSILAGGEWRGEFHNRKKNGELYWEQAHISPIRDNSYSITHFIAIKEDITERKKLENQLRHSQKMEAIGQLAGGIAHDFNNILTAIIGYSSIMQFKLPDDSPLKKSAGQIIETAERGAALTQGLLAFSRKQVSNPVVIDLNEILNRVQQLLQRLISEDIQLELTLSQQQLPVMADSVQIEQVLMNLATNAHDVLQKGGTISIKTEALSIDSNFILARGFGQPGPYAMLTFSDNGLGMDSETVKHIFEPFYTTKEIGKGTGLGLSIVYGIIKKHNGYITCHSTEGIGTIFQIYLPLLNAPPATMQSLHQNGPSYQQGKDVILFAEDDEAGRELGKEILQEFGYTVIEASDGLQALELFKANCNAIDLVLLDVTMPKLSGKEVYDAIRIISPGMKALFYSGYSEEVVISQGRLDHGMNYLAKPYSPKDLLMKVREVLDNGN